MKLTHASVIKKNLSLSSELKEESENYPSHFGVKEKCVVFCSLPIPQHGNENN
jgi:hypothetical protein